jgi:hypothetical protein
MSIRVNGCKCVGRNGDTYYFVDSIFDHGDGFAGCTGFSVRPVCAEEFNSWDHDAVAEYLEECGSHDGMSCRKFHALVDEAIRVDGIGHIIYDDGFGCEVGPFFNALGIDYECTDCVGCGRQFSEDSDYEELFDHAAWIGVTGFEAGEVSFEWAARTIFGNKAYLKGLCDYLNRKLSALKAELARLDVSAE